MNRETVSQALVICLMVAAAIATNMKLPEYIQPCNRNDFEIDKCLTTSLQTILLKLAKGAPEFELEPLDPFNVPEILVQYRQGEVNGKMLIKNTRSYGLTNINVLGVRSVLNDSNRFELEVDIYQPSMFIEGDYKAQGKIVVFPINGKGVYNISMTDVTATWNLTGEHISKKGEDFVHITHFSMFPEVGDMKFYASNLFTGNDDFNKVALLFANEFWPVIYNELLPYINEGWDKVMRGVFNNVFLKIPFNEMFPNA